MGGSRSDRWAGRDVERGPQNAVPQASSGGASKRPSVRIGRLAQAGADTVYLHVYDIGDLDHIALIGAEVLPHVAARPEGALQ